AHHRGQSRLHRAIVLIFFWHRPGELTRGHPEDPGYLDLDLVGRCLYASRSTQHSISALAQSLAHGLQALALRRPQTPSTETTIDHKILPVDEGCTIGSQEDGRLGDVIRRSRTRNGLHP